MKTISLAAARDNLYKLAMDTIESHEPIIISSKSGDVVMLSKEYYKAMEETLYLQKNNKLLEEVKD